MTLPVVAIVGRPNVGKSTLFNCLTRTRNAIMSPFPGTTRDRQYGKANIDDRHFILVDTGGISDHPDEMSKLICHQTKQAIEEANAILFLIDGRAGVLPEDIQIAKMVRKEGKKVFLIVNKTEKLDPSLFLSDAYELGLNEPILIAAEHRQGIDKVIKALFPNPNPQIEKIEDKKVIRFAIVGKPNVGKSTLTNRLLGEERVIVNDISGTTRDSIEMNLTHNDQSYVIIDTAGVRKRKNINEVPEKFSVVKTLQSIQASNLIVYLIDALTGVTEQDLRLLGFILECGRGLVLAVNKWDGLPPETKALTKASLDRQLTFLDFARLHFISALHGTGVGNLFESIDEAFLSATKKISTPLLNKLLSQAIATHQPPLIKGRRVKLRYAHIGGHNPPRVIIHGTQLDALPESYRKFLINFFQKKLKLKGTPLYIEYKVSQNPFH